MKTSSELLTWLFNKNPTTVPNITTAEQVFNQQNLPKIPIDVVLSLCYQTYKLGHEEQTTNLKLHKEMLDKVLIVQKPPFRLSVFFRNFFS